MRFYVPDGYRWQSIRNHGADGKLGEFVTAAMREVARLNPDLRGVLDVKDFNERQAGERTLGDERLAALIEVISRHRPGLANTEPDVLGRAYEYLLRKFAEGQGQSAGEKADYNLSLSQFVEVGERVSHRDLADILADLRAAREERERADAALAEVLGRLGLEA